MTTTSEPADAATRTKPRLIVFLPGIGKDRSDALVRRIRDHGREGSTRVVTFAHKVKPWSIRRTPELAADNLDAFIEREARDASDIVLVGHSIGGLIVRSAWLKGLGYDSASPSEWPAKLERIALLGVPNSGFKFRKGATFLKALYLFASPFADFGIEHAKSGGYWVTNLRLRWLEAFRDLPVDLQPYLAEVIGVDDSLVTRDDIKDSGYMPSLVRYRLDDTDHAGLIEVRSAEEAQRRWPTIRQAIFEDRRSAPPQLPVSKQKVYFIFHGIRASADDDWVTAMRRELQATGAKVVAPDTGYFSAFEFALPFVRNRKAHDFLEKYGDNAVTHDPDNFAFLGHSNGTYMMGRSMLRVPAVRFRYILLAGSVLNPKYDWELLRQRKQVGSYQRVEGARQWKHGAVHNERARIDVPVGVLAAFLSGLKPFNRHVGPGGTVGFVNAEGIVGQDDTLYTGGHAGALGTSDPERRDQIAAFLKKGKVTDAPTAHPSRFFHWVGRIIPMLSWLTVALLVALLAVLVVVLWNVPGIGAWALLIVGGPLLLIYVLLRTV